MTSQHTAAGALSLAAFIFAVMALAIGFGG